MLTGGNGKCSQLQWQYKKSLRTLVRFFSTTYVLPLKTVAASLHSFFSPSTTLPERELRRQFELRRLDERSFNAQTTLPVRELQDNAP